MLTPIGCVVDRGFDPRSVYTKDC